MHKGVSVLLSFMVISGISLVNADSAFAGDVNWRDGNWRLELSGITAFRSGHRSRTGDVGLAFSAEYEVPLPKHFAFGVKTYPLFFYDQDDSGEDTIFGVGVGPELRVYSNGEEHRGFFFEVGSSALVTTGKFDGNSGTFNFYSEAGIGYKFKRDWHVSAKVGHISNAGISSSNSGVNSMGLALGYTF